MPAADRVRPLRLALAFAFALCLAPAAPEDLPVSRHAHRLAVDGKRKQALELLNRQLTAIPSDVDARLVRGIVLTWDGRYDEARTDLVKVLETSPEYGDAIVAYMNLELWSGNLDAADAFAKRMLGLDFGIAPPPPMQLSQTVAGLRPPPTATDQLAFPPPPPELAPPAASLVPAKPELRDSKPPPGQPSTDSEPRFEIGYDHTETWFSDGRASWQEHSASVGFEHPWISTTGRFYHARRGDYVDEFFELETYPHLGSGRYAYLAGGFSRKQELYSRYRFAGELYQSLPRGFEISGGMRYLRFHEPVRLYTGSVAKYLGSWLLTIRPYLSTDRLGPSHSYQFSARRYFRKETSWATFRFGYGASPTEVRSINEIELLNSQSFSNEWNLRLNRALAFRFMAGIALNDRVERSRLRQYIFGGTLFYGF